MKLEQSISNNITYAQTRRSIQTSEQFITCDLFRLINAYIKAQIHFFSQWKYVKRQHKHLRLTDIKFEVKWRSGGL